MGTIPFAFSVHHFINSVGSDAGFASIIGLAILVLLYFAQARETANLREQAYEGSQRVQQLEARLAHLTRAAGGPQAAPAGAQPASRTAGEPIAARAGMPARAPAPATAFAGAAAGPPGPPAGVAAPALAAATRLIPTAETAFRVPEPAISGSAEPATGHVASPAAVAAVATPPPATAAGGANGAGKDHGVASQSSRATPTPARAAGLPLAEAPRAQSVGTQSAGGQSAGGQSAGGQSAGRQSVGTQSTGTQSTGGQSAGTQAPRRPAAAGRRSQLPPLAPEPTGVRPGRVLIVLLSLLAIGAIVAVLLFVTGAASNTRSSSSGSSATNALSAASRKAPAVKPASVTVAVLNGTGTAGLARRTSLRLGAEGYREGAVATASDQTLTNTIVAYLPGHRADALAVATSLKLRPSAVQPVDAGTQAVACPPPAACAADVVVTLGSNLPAS